MTIANKAEQVLATFCTGSSVSITFGVDAKLNHNLSCITIIKGKTNSVLKYDNISRMTFKQEIAKNKYKKNISYIIPYL